MDVELRAADAVTVILYLAATLGFGLYVARRNNSTEAYFLGNRGFPGWAIGISILGTSISSMTFISMPAAAYSLDWRLLTSNFMVPVIAVIAMIFFIPIFRQRRITTAYEYLNIRFGPIAQWYAVASGLLFQFYRISAVLFLVSIPVHLATGIAIWQIIVIMGVLVTAYTVLGGIEAVIWTDVMQAVVLLLGGVISYIFIVNQLPGGSEQVFAAASFTNEAGEAVNKFSLGENEWNLGERTLWTMLILGFVGWMNFFVTDQSVVQRYIASRSTGQARFATGLYAVTVLPTWAFFYLIGTALFVFYQQFPNEEVATMAGAEADTIFPYFILTELPVVLTGIIIAGLLAAAMSSLDSSMNAISTVLTTDVLRGYLMRGRSDAFYLRCAKLTSLATGIIMIFGAIGFSQLPKESMTDINWIMTSLLAGGLVGLFFAGMFSKRIGYKSVIVALACAFVTNVFLGKSINAESGMTAIPNLHSYWIGTVVNLLFLAVAWAFSFVFREPIRDQQVDGLTVWTLDREKID